MEGHGGMEKLSEDSFPGVLCAGVGYHEQNTGFKGHTLELGCELSV